MYFGKILILLFIHSTSDNQHLRQNKQLNSVLRNLNMACSPLYFFSRPNSMTILHNICHYEMVSHICFCFYDIYAISYDVINGNPYVHELFRCLATNAWILKSRLKNKMCQFQLLLTFGAL